MRWNANIFTSSRRQGMLWPFAENSRPAKLSMGPVGPCSPGIHSGYTNVISPGCTGISSCARSILRGASVISRRIEVGRFV